MALKCGGRLWQKEKSAEEWGRRRGKEKTTGEREGRRKMMSQEKKKENVAKLGVAHNSLVDVNTSAKFHSVGSSFAFYTSLN